jgi:hypothetical protein
MNTINDTVKVMHQKLCPCCGQLSEDVTKPQVGTATEPKDWKSAYEQNLKVIDQLRENIARLEAILNKITYYGSIRRGPTQKIAEQPKRTEQCTSAMCPHRIKGRTE